VFDPASTWVSKPPECLAQEIGLSKGITVSALKWLKLQPYKISYTIFAAMRLVTKLNLISSPSSWQHTWSQLDEAWFYLNGYLDMQNNREWSTQDSHTWCSNPWCKCQSLVHLECQEDYWSYIHKKHLILKDM
jgi:hypothetical protein